ncbi:signal transduction histidine kinase [Isoptericola sp. CG 20/1183]|uniref:histidine kinase n=1 Tax=Isoptericola halotolerans TaxID=300560 RepID=A0ABX5ECH1_9MICO|nr:signal transduction histidine kinase [Isoptericola halotolerans]PRZ06099.1 signal transduction histidine kinase [Isoptericola sp. CG 20/1183]
MNTAGVVRRTGLRPLALRPAAPGAEPPRRRDAILSGLLVAAAVAEGVLRTDLVWPVAGTAVTVVALAALPWRRVHPLAVVAVATLGGTALALVQLAAGRTPTTLYTAVALILAAYALFRWGSGRAVLGGATLLVAGLAVSIGVQPAGLDDVLGGIAFLLLVAALGELRRHHVAARAHDLEQAGFQERTRIARDLHDTLAHTLSAIAVRAQAGQVAARREPAAAVDALAPIEHEARAALGELRAIVGAMRTSGDDALRRPAPGLDDLIALAGQDGAGSLEVSVRVADDVGALAPSVATALYRIAQEAVTNARRHADAASRVRVDVGRTSDAVTLRVHDDGVPPVARHTAGHGTVGMAERAALLGGRCTAGPDPDGGWTVTAALPTGAVR